jgi:hypothetical protein
LLLEFTLSLAEGIEMTMRGLCALHEINFESKSEISKPFLTTRHLSLDTFFLEHHLKPQAEHGVCTDTFLARDKRNPEGILADRELVFLSPSDNLDVRR